MPRLALSAEQLEALALPPGSYFSFDTGMLRRADGSLVEPADLADEEPWSKFAPATPW